MNKQFSNLAVFILAATVLAGCPSISNMKTVEVDVMTSAEIELPSNVENLLIVDRTVYTGNPFDSNEAMLRPAVPGETREAIETLIFFLQRYLGGSPRFQTVVASETLTGNSLSRAFPTPIPWDTVRELCRRYGADVLVAIEVYDSDFNISNNPRARRAEQPILNDPQETTFQRYSPYEYTIAGAGNIIFGFRVYDPSTESIVDEHIYRNRETWEGTGPDPASAAEGLPQRERAIGELIQLAGMEYAKRIAPIPIPVERKYFGGSGTDSALAKGAELAEADQWLQAADVWQAGISQASKSEAGQLAHNVAVAYEKLGRTEQAHEWATRASEEYGNSQAKDYLATLEEYEEKKDTLDIDTGGQINLPGVSIGK
jgi:tetratricopeptide (TPR) repeat protein